jgi:hypothetical protein
VSWDAGDTLLVRYRDRNGVLRGARPLRYVDERSGYVAGWLAAGTVCAMPVLDDGSPIRSVPESERYRRGRASALQPWHGEGIVMLLPRAPAAHSIWLFWRSPDDFWGWYVNLEAPHAWHARGCDTRDHILDIFCETPGEWQWKDEHELAEAVANGAVTASFADGVRAEGERVAAMIERWDPPFCDEWEVWRPDPSWPVAELPEDWAA